MFRPPKFLFSYPYFVLCLQSYNYVMFLFKTRTRTWFHGMKRFFFYRIVLRKFNITSMKYWIHHVNEIHYTSVSINWNVLLFLPSYLLQQLLFSLFCVSYIDFSFWWIFSLYAYHRNDVTYFLIHVKHVRYFFNDIHYSHLL